MCILVLCVYAPRERENERERERERKGEEEGRASVGGSGGRLIEID